MRRGVPRLYTMFVQFLGRRDDAGNMRSFRLHCRAHTPRIETKNRGKINSENKQSLHKA